MSAALRWVRTRTATWPGRMRSRRLDRAVLVADLDLGVRGEQRGEVGREVLGDVLARGWRCSTLPPRVSFSDGSSRWTTLMRSGARHGRVAEPRRLVGVGGPDPAVDDAFVPELGAAEQRVVGVDEALVAAPVDLERRALVGPVGRFEVGVDVGAAEGVDRLLRVADEDERRVAVPEGAAHDVPLDGVGVLELVDEDDAVALSAAARPRPRRRGP